MGREVGVENREQLALRDLQGIVDVSRLGMLVVGAADITNFPLRTQIAEPVAPAVVQHPDFEAGIVEGLCRDDSPLDELAALVVRGEEDVHGRQALGGKSAQPFLVAVGLARSVRVAAENHQGECHVHEDQDLDRQRTEKERSAP